MDIEKLIERLRTESLYKDKATLEIMDLCMEAATALSTLQTEAEGMRSNWYKSVEKIKELQAELEEMTQRNDENLGMCRIWEHRYTKLQAENEKLKNKLSELAHLPFDETGIGERTRLMAENAQLRDELEQAKVEITRLKYYEDKCHDCPIVCAKTEIIKAHEELEAVQAELEQVKRDFDGICEYIDSEGFLRKQFCENGNPDLEPCICLSLQEHPGYIDSDDCEGCDHFCNSWRGPKEG